MNTNFDRTEFHVDRRPFLFDRLEVLVVSRKVRAGRAEEVRTVAPLVLQPLTQEQESGVEFKPTFTLSPEEGQQLMDELWRAGLRPTEGQGSAGQMAAVQAHLQDMRTLVFESKQAQPRKFHNPEL